MNNDTTLANPIPGVRAGATDTHGAESQIARLAKALTPDLHLNPRAALRDMRVVGPLSAVLRDPALSAELTLEDAVADDPYADASGYTQKRQFNVLRSSDDEVVLLQIPDWFANNGLYVGALEEIRDTFMNRKVRIVADMVQTPARSLEKTLPRIWCERANIDVEFASWRYVTELLEGKRSPSQVFEFGASSAATRKSPPGAAKPVERIFISSTGLDLTEYRDVARKLCLSMDFMPIMMENFEAMGLGATAGSLKKLDQAGIYVGIFAHRYGYIEPGYTVSVTELEFDHAAKRNIPQLCFVVDPAHPWPPNSWDPEHHAQMEAFKKHIDRLIHAQFTTPDSFRAALTESLTPWYLRSGDEQYVSRVQTKPMKPLWR